MPYEVKTFKRGKDMLAPKELKEIHPLGKSPVISVQGPNSSKPIVIAESGMITEYLCDHFGGDKLIPARYVEGKEGQIGGETEEWLRYRYYMHFSEGSLMPFLVFKLVTDSEFINSQCFPSIVTNDPTSHESTSWSPVLPEAHSPNCGRSG